MDKTELKDKLKTGVDKAVEVSKKAAVKAGAAIQDFSDKSVIRIEKHSFETKLSETYKKIGQLASDKFLVSSDAELKASDDDVRSLLADVQKFKAEIAKRAELLSKKE